LRAKSEEEQEDLVELFGVVGGDGGSVHNHFV
jgi:hypothetical protein